MARKLNMNRLAIVCAVAGAVLVPVVSGDALRFYKDPTTYDQVPCEDVPLERRRECRPNWPNNPRTYVYVSTIHRFNAGAVLIDVAEGFLIPLLVLLIGPHVVRRLYRLVTVESSS